MAMMMTGCDLSAITKPMGSSK
uniref:PDEase domain-containing protein n=1 Tax=Anguilla anguilla TaxID=7936 RepID=A0A0E9PTN8_ANGAN